MTKLLQKIWITVIHVINIQTLLLHSNCICVCCLIYASYHQEILITSAGGLSEETTEPYTIYFIFSSDENVNNDNKKQEYK